MGARNHNLIASQPGIYKAVKGDVEVVGTPREIEEKTGIKYDYVAKVARSTGRKTRGGWKVYLVKPSCRANLDYIAERIGDDPIIGPVEEIASLTGKEIKEIRKIILTGRSDDGWRVKPYFEKKSTREHII